MTDVEIQCRCGHVHGEVRNVSPRTVNRAICYCDDCQTYLHYLGRADLFEPHAGTDIVQVAPAAMSFDRGTDQIMAVRLSPKGLYRWHARCCKTPLGNTVKPSIPFVGIAREAFGDLSPERRDEIFGVAFPFLTKFAVDGPPPGSKRIPVGGLVHSLGFLIRNKLSAGWPNPFFDRDTHAPRYAITVISKSERAALRELCGPRPTRTARA